MLSVTPAVLPPGFGVLSADPADPLSLMQIGQLAMVVRDVEATVRAYADQLGVGPWRFYTYGPEVLRESTYRGQAGRYRMRLAYTWLGPLQLEVIQPLAGPSIYEDFLRDHGEGMHHVGLFVEDFDAAVQALEARGYPLIQSGRGFGAQGDGAFAYFETEGYFATTVELISPPKERRPPEAIYPAETSAG